MFTELNHKHSTVILTDSDLTFYKHDRNLIHREHGLAIIHVGGYVVWVKNNEISRTNGPAIIFESGIKAYWVDGIEYSKDEYFLLYGVL